MLPELMLSLGLVNAMHSGQSLDLGILKQITYMGISIMLKSQGRENDQNAMHLPKPRKHLLV